ncbi:PVC-type heme-binding CxxCH protein [Rhodopirellula sp. P2]|uniref:PVC-type heme-binding CxxCH protein n=1 Tax=Rhodopirellula sp. P2 TaxID=2127060 RepID=UPI002368E143|nr:PVC-type heme-binding CxxCH protein [Rhodopirellula sp. P2]WDQ18399.1 HEAT repeat domain-containing protein [Rhodopirellula sp. P2]
MSHESTLDPQPMNCSPLLQKRTDAIPDHDLAALKKKRQRFLRLCCVIVFLAGCAWLQPHACVSAQSPRAAVLQPLQEFNPPEIHVPDGFTVELAAGPPLVEHPTFATLDDQGRMFVCENAGVNMTAEELEEHLPNSIRLLEDTNADGRFDKSTVFADNMTFPMGGAWHDGALYVASPPSIWRLEDTDGDGVADQREVIVDKFGYTGNAASIHGCVLGPDGRLHWCDGYHGHEIKDAEGTITSQRFGSYLFSCFPDGSDVRIHCGGGMDNPVEVDFTDEGEMLGTVNIFETRPRADCLVHWLHGGAYPHREQVLSELKVTGDVLGAVHHFGHVAVSGTTRYRSGILDADWRDNLFATFFNSGKVVRIQLHRDGASFRASQREFLTCQSRDFHPTDVTEDADGSLLVVDTGGWFYRGCPTSQFAKPDVQGGIYRVRRRTATKHGDPRGNQIDWAGQADSEPVKLLTDSRFAVRERAIAECAKRGNSIVPSLTQTLGHPEPLARRNAVWALTRIIGNAQKNRPPTPHPTSTAAKTTASNRQHHAMISSTWNEARAAIRQALDDRHPSVRQAACRSIATYPDPAALGRLLKMIQHDEPPIRREAATALGRLGDAKAVPALLEALNNAGDRTEEHALVYAMIEIDDPEKTRVGLAANNANVQRGTLFALDQMDSGNLTVEEVVPLAAADDPELQRAAAEIFSRHPEWSLHSVVVIAELLKRPQSAERNQVVIRKLTTRSLSDDSVGSLIGRLLGASNTPRQTYDLLLAAIADGRDVTLHDSWIEPLKRLLNEAAAASQNSNSAVSSPPEQRDRFERTLAALSAIRSDRFRSQLNQMGANESIPVPLRVAAIEAASEEHGRLTDFSLALLLGLLDGSPQEGLTAAQKIGGSGLSESQLIQLAPRLASVPPSQLQELIRPFQRSQNPDVAKAFLTAMKDSRSLTSLTPTQFSDTIMRYPRDLLPEANELLDRIQRETQARLARLDRLLPKLSQGDAERGRQLFFSEKSKCATCHRVGSKGGQIGPDLTTIGANRADRDLLESIVFPSATIVRDYETYSVLTVDGRVLTGLIARETSDALHLQQQTGEPVAIAHDDIEEMVPSIVSTMPSDLDKTLSESELADVVAYLKSLNQLAPPEAATGTEK